MQVKDIVVYNIFPFLNELDKFYLCLLNKNNYTFINYVNIDYCKFLYLQYVFNKRYYINTYLSLDSYFKYKFNDSLLIDLLIQKYLSSFKTMKISNNIYYISEDDYHKVLSPYIDKKIIQDPITLHNFHLIEFTI